MGTFPATECGPVFWNVDQIPHYRNEAGAQIQLAGKVPRVDGTLALRPLPKHGFGSDIRGPMASLIDRTISSLPSVDTGDHPAEREILTSACEPGHGPRVANCPDRLNYPVSPSPVHRQIINLLLQFAYLSLSLLPPSPHLAAIST